LCAPLFSSFFFFFHLFFLLLFLLLLFISKEHTRTKPQDLDEKEKDMACEKIRIVLLKAYSNLWVLKLDFPGRI
jgi:hypothetical protein